MNRNKIDKATLISKIQQADGLTNEEKSSLMALLNEDKTYGLVWEDSPEEVEENLRSHIPVLHEVTERALTDGGADAPNHILIEGDNLDALTALSYTHEGKIDVIYIDPPYNTGNKDFVYNDSYVDTEDSYRHSKWLSFMNRRLRIAKRLLSDKGVIFISIDDNEQADLKMLCDEVFGEDKFVSNIIWQKNYASKNNSQGIPAATEYLVTYSKLSGWTPNRLPRTEEMDSKYKNPDNDVAPWRSDNPCAPGAISHQGMVYAIQHPFTGELLYPYNGACWRYQQDDLLEIMNGWCKYELRDLNDDEERAKICGITSDKVRKGVKGIVLSHSLEDSKIQAEMILRRGQWPKYYFTKNGKGGIARKTYLTNVEGRLVTSFWPYTEVNHTDGAKKELKDIFNNEIPFDTPKPIDLLKRINEIASQTNSIILDFFAGSGTTLHATMQLNAEDGGHRQCILVTNNENSICEQVTYERNKRVIQGYTTPKGQAVEGLSNNNLRYYKIDYTNRAHTHENRMALAQAMTELLQIKNGAYEAPELFGHLKVKPRYMRYFRGDNDVLVVYVPEIIPHLVNEIKAMSFNGKLQVYVAIDGNYPFADEFAPVATKVEVVAIPSVYYHALKHVLPDASGEPTPDDTPNDEDAQLLGEANKNDYQD